MVAKYKPGQIVRVKRATFSNHKDFIAVICDEGDDPDPCMICEEDGCVEWANVLEVNGGFHFHIPECQMELVNKEDCWVVHKG